MIQYEYRLVALNYFDAQGTGSPDLVQIKMYIHSQQVLGWELVSIGSGVIVFRKEIK
jgi:hypothetical protein